MPRTRIYLPKTESKLRRDALRRMGYDSYESYLVSDRWRLTRRRLIGKKCEICSSRRRLVLHHVTYAGLGREKTADVATLCARCHRAVHLSAMRTGSLAISRPRPMQERIFTALEVDCPACGSRAGVNCRTTSGSWSGYEHKQRRVLLDQRRRADGAYRRARRAKKAARSRGLTAAQLKAIKAAREAEFPLDRIRGR